MDLRRVLIRGVRSVRNVRRELRQHKFLQQIENRSATDANRGVLED